MFCRYRYPLSLDYFIDLTMLLFTWVNPQTYIMKIVYLLIGCLILGFGVYMEVLADVVMLLGKSFDPSNRSDMENQLWYDKNLL